MAFKQTPQLIASAFSSAFRQKRTELQRQREVAQNFAQREREQGLINYWKDQNLKFKGQQEEADLLREKGLLKERQDKATIAAEQEVYERGQDKKAGLLAQRKFDLSKEKFEKGRDAPVDTKSAFSDYLRKREGFLSQSIVGDEGEDIPRTQGEIISGRRSARDTAVSALTKSAQRFYVSRFQNKQTSKWDFKKAIDDAYGRGELTDADANLLEDFNNFRGDWGELPREEQEERKQDKKPNVYQPEGLLDTSLVDEIFNPQPLSISDSSIFKDVGGMFRRLQGNR